MILLLLAALLLAVAQKKKKKNETQGELPRPGGSDADLRSYVCSLVGEDIPATGLLPLFMRRKYPAVSWPAADEWTDEDVAALPMADAARYLVGARALSDMTKDAAWLAACTLWRTPYASGEIKWKNGKFKTVWAYDDKVYGDRGGSIGLIPEGGSWAGRAAGFDSARELLLNAVWYFGASANPDVRFAEAHVKPGSASRLSIWENLNGSFDVVVIREDGTDNLHNVSTIGAARAIVGTL